MIALRFLVLTAFWCLGTFRAAASWSYLPVRVISLSTSKSPDHYTFVFEAVTSDYGTQTGLPAKKRRFEVRMRHDPRFGPLNTYREGIRILRDRITLRSEITIGRNSGQGWRQVRGKQGIFETVGLRVHRPKGDQSDEHANIIFVHDDRY